MITDQGCRKFHFTRLRAASLFFLVRRTKRARMHTPVTEGARREMHENRETTRDNNLPTVLANSARRRGIECK